VRGDIERKKRRERGVWRTYLLRGQLDYIESCNETLVGLYRTSFGYLVDLFFYRM